MKRGAEGQPELVPSLFVKLAPPAVAEYQAQQKALVEKMKALSMEAMARDHERTLKMEEHAKKSAIALE